VALCTVSLSLMPWAARSNSAAEAPFLYVVSGYRYNGNFDLPPGTWIDDTSMTLCLAQSLVDRQGQFVLHDQIRKYVKWKKYGYMSATGECFDIGDATRESLRIWAESMKSGEDASPTEMKYHQEVVDQFLKREVRSPVAFLEILAEPSPTVIMR